MRTKTQKNQAPEWTVCLPDTPVGSIFLTFTARGLAALDFADNGCQLTPPAVLPPALSPLAAAVEDALSRYFADGTTDFADLPLDLQGTPFQKRVWQELQHIPRGGTISYKELAQRAGSPKAYRAAGQANGRNPIPIIVPCHRVIAADGTLGGYSSGLERKKWLLKHEGAR